MNPSSSQWRMILRMNVGGTRPGSDALQRMEVDGLMREKAT